MSNLYDPFPCPRPRMNPLAKRTGTQHQALSSETKRGFLGKIAAELRVFSAVCYRDCWDHSPTAYSDMTTKPPTHSLSAAHPEMPKKPLPLVGLNMADSGLDLVHGLQLTAV